MGAAMNKFVTCEIRRLEFFNLYPASADPLFMFSEEDNDQAAFGRQSENNC